jgi:hypothetical protein
MPTAGVESTSISMFAAFANEDGKWEIDITDFTDIDVERLDRQLEKIPSGKHVELQPGDPALPAGFAHGDSWTLVTSAGSEHHTVVSISAYAISYIEEVPEIMHLSIGLGEAPKGAKGPAIAIRGHLGPGIELVMPAAIGPDELGADTYDRIMQVLEKEPRDFSNEGLELVRPEHVKLFPGRFPGDRTHVVVVQSDGDGDDTQAVAGMLLRKADGTLELLACGSFAFVTLVGLIDVNGDGLDEVVYQYDTSDPWSVEMIEWNGAEVRSRTLAEDGL